MNYNEEYKRQGVIRNSGCAEHTSCPCPMAEKHHTPDHDHRENDCGCPKKTCEPAPSVCRREAERVVRNNSYLGCQQNTCRVREATPNRPSTICTTVPVTEGCVDTYPVAMAYVPMQQWRELYDPVSALHHGTIFRELDLYWYPTNCRKDCNCK